MPPTHADITRAVAATGDAELASWVENPASYTTTAVEMAELAHYQLYRVMLDASHPMSFFVAFEASSSDAVVTSGNPEGLAAVLRREPGLAQSSELVRRVFELFREQSLRQALILRGDDLPSSAARAKPLVRAPEVVREDGWTISMTILTGKGRLLAWTLRVPSEGKATFASETLATDLEVSLGP